MRGQKYSFVEKPYHHAVTVHLYPSAAGPAGHIFPPPRRHGEAIGFDIAPQDGSMSAEQAVREAKRIAGRLGVPMVVMGERHFWEPSWGDLEG